MSTYYMIVFCEILDRADLQSQNTNQWFLGAQMESVAAKGT